MMVYEELALILLPLIGKLRKIAKFNVIPPPQMFQNKFSDLKHFSMLQNSSSKSYPFKAQNIFIRIYLFLKDSIDSPQIRHGCVSKCHCK